jgi:hypothetical protein
MGAFSRSKGQSGEREVARIIYDITGWDVKRKVRNLEGESDLEGVPHWCVEVKNCAKLEVMAWWRQTTQQAARVNQYPLLLYKVPRRGWRAVWPLAVLLGQPSDMVADYGMTCESSVEAWAAVAREVLGAK